MNKKLTFSTIFAFILSAPLVLAETHSVRGDLSAFVEAFKCIFNLNTTCFANNIITSASLFGLIMIVYGLTYFIAVSTIFSDEKYHKYARIIAVGIAIIGLAQQKVYDAILGFSSTFLILTFLTAIIFMAVMFFNRTKTTHLETAQKMREAKQGDLKAKKELLEVEHEFNLDKKYYKKLNSDLSKLETDLQGSSQLLGSEKHQVDEITRLLNQLSSAAQHSDKGLVSQYAQSLANQVGSLISSMKHEDKLDNDLDMIVEKINAVLSHWSHDDIKAANIENKEAHLMKQMVSRLGHEFDEKQHKKIVAENRALSNIFHQIHSVLHELSSLNKQITIQTEKLNNLGYRKKHMEASEMRTAIFDGDYKQAHGHLDNLRALVEQEPNALGHIHALSSKMNSLIASLERNEKEANRIIDSELVQLTNDFNQKEAKLNKDMKIYSAQSNEIIATINRLLPYGTQTKNLLDTAHERGVYIYKEYIGFFNEFKNVLDHTKTEITKKIADKKNPYNIVVELKSRLEGFLSASSLDWANTIPNSASVNVGKKRNWRDPAMVLDKSKAMLKILRKHVKKAIDDLNVPLKNLKP